MTGRAPAPSLTDRVRAALKRERQASAAIIARGIGARPTSVHSALWRGVRDGWARLVQREGREQFFAFVDASGEKA